MATAKVGVRNLLKIMEHAYAEALWRIIEKGTDPKHAVQSLREELEKRGRSRLLPHIAKAFARLAERKARKNDPVLTVAREKDVHKAREAAKKVLEQLKHPPHDLKTRVDESLIGGWRLEGRGALVDASYKKQLLDLYDRATK